MTRRTAAREASENRAFRDPATVVTHWPDADRVDPALLDFRGTDGFWEALHEERITLLVTREYEHLAVGLSVNDAGRPVVSFLPVPHPSGLAFDRARGLIHLASTRNPNQVLTLAPVSADAENPAETPLVPIRSVTLPGSLYLHDLAMVGGRLHANAVGRDAVVRIDPDGSFQPVWWPRCVDTGAGPSTRNHLQLNSIAAGETLGRSFFSASAARPSRRRPGHLNFPVDRRGVVFGGATREPVLTGLTRPHSARLHRGTLWVDNSGHGEVGVSRSGVFAPVLRLPGWTRGLGYHGGHAFVGTSRVLTRFRAYAPGLDPARCVAGVHVFEPATGRLRGHLLWPAGNQIFAVEAVPRDLTAGFPFSHPRRRPRLERALFSSFSLRTTP